MHRFKNFYILDQPNELKKGHSLTEQPFLILFYTTYSAASGSMVIDNRL